MLLARVQKEHAAQILLASALLLIFNGCGRAPKEDRAARSVEPPAAQQLPDDQPDYASTTPEQAAEAASPMLETQMIPAPAAPAPAPMRAPAGVAVTKQYNGESTRRPAMKSRIARIKTDPAFDTQPRVEAMESLAAPTLEASQAMSAEMAPAEGPFSNLPAGATRQDEQGFATIQVFYATDRSRGALPLSAYEVTGKKQAFMMLAGCSVMLFVFSAFSWLRGKSRAGNITALVASVAGVAAAACIAVGQANIEKHGVTYTGDRGTLTRGICEVTVPDIHQRGMVERPSLMRFEIKENQRQHVVLTSAVELSAGDFQQRLSETLSSSAERDLLVFIHGYNVNFESAVQRTAQIAVDLPFEGVPVCYSWPSQGSLIGYSIDETNAEWTMTHLKQFLFELANESGAQSINVVAHSMGNRPMTAAMEQIRWQLDENSDAPFDRIVLAAPDVDADRFRRDLAPSLLNVANHVTLYASSDDQALIASKQVHG